jgi:hypothetical protein
MILQRCNILDHIVQLSPDRIHSILLNYLTSFCICISSSSYPNPPTTRTHLPVVDCLAEPSFLDTASWPLSLSLSKSETNTLLFS